MSCKKKNLFLIALLFVFVLTISVGAATFSTNVKASGSYDLSMTAGAQLKIVTQVDVENGINDALRFVTKIPKNQITDTENTKVVTIFTRTDYLKEKDLNTADGFKLENLEDITYQTVAFSAQKNNLTANTSGDYYVFNACLYNIQPKNWSKEISARSYIEVGETIVAYTDYTYLGEGAANDNAASIWEVAANYKDILDPNGDGDVADRTNELDEEVAATQLSYVKDLCVTVKLTGFDGKVYDLKARAGHTFEGYKADIENLANIAGTAYYKGSLVDANTTDVITADSEVTLDMAAIEFTYRENALELTTKLESTATTYAAADTYTVSSVKAIQPYCDGEYVIPETYNGKTVAALGTQLFHDLGTDDTTGRNTVRKITANSVTYVGYLCFFNCKSLETVIIPNVIRLFYYAHFTNQDQGKCFEGCTSLTTVVVNKDIVINSGNFKDTNNAEIGGIDLCLTDGTALTSSYGTSEQGRLTSGKIYAYSDNPYCGDWGYDNSGEIAKYDHNYNDKGICAGCGHTKGLIYTLDGTTYTITGATSDIGKEVYINDTYRGISVSKIAANALKTHSSYANSTYMQAITLLSLPESIVSIGSGAFANWTGLQTIIFHCEVTNSLFGSIAFQNVSVPNIVIYKNFTFKYQTAIFGSTASATSIYKMSSGLTITINFASSYNSPLANAATRAYVYSPDRPTDESALATTWAWNGSTPTLWSKMPTA